MISALRDSEQRDSAEPTKLLIYENSGIVNGYYLKPSNLWYFKLKSDLTTGDKLRTYVCFLDLHIVVVFLLFIRTHQSLKLFQTKIHIFGLLLKIQEILKQGIFLHGNKQLQLSSKFPLDRR